MPNQEKARRDYENYEEYWKVTLEYSDVNDWRFLGTLRIIKEFIDENVDALQGEYSTALYSELQRRVNEFNPKMETSVRKSINQFVKLGFVNPFGRGYHKNLDDFLNAQSGIPGDDKRRIIFSKIVYENSNFQSSWTNDDPKKGHVKFLIKTLEKTKKLCKEDILALMRVDIDTINEDYLSREALDGLIDENWNTDFIDRKYNQLSHFRGILGRLDDLTFETEYPHGDCLMFTEYADEQFPDRWRHEGRDPYLQNRYRRLLAQESFEVLGAKLTGEAKNIFRFRKAPFGIAYGNQFIQCMVSGNAGECIASHMKPFSRCTEDEAYDANNGLYLSEEIDKHFDKGRISFSDDGKIIFRRDFPDISKKKFENFQIEPKFLNKKRLEYLHFHRSSVMENK